MHVPRLLRLRPLLLAVLLPVLMGQGDEEEHGCGGGHDDGGHDDGGHVEGELGPPTGTECPPASTLTYEGFGRPFLQSYCLRCHSGSVTGAAREGAPADHNFDTLIEAQGLADHIDRKAGSGPDATNESMPIGDPEPTLEERQQLAQWLACGAP
jgi:hypothetical protein